MSVVLKILLDPRLREPGTLHGDYIRVYCLFTSFKYIFQVAVERSKEYTDIVREKPEYVEPRPPTSWPLKGEIKCEGLVIRYAVSAHWHL